jgi:hypothetical protein
VRGTVEGMVHGGCVGQKPKAPVVGGSGSGPRWRRSVHHDKDGAHGWLPAPCHLFSFYGRPEQRERHGWGQHTPVSGAGWQPPCHVVPGGQMHLCHHAR